MTAMRPEESGGAMQGDDAEGEQKMMRRQVAAVANRECRDRRARGADDVPATMPAITLQQPYASLVASGLKRVETRPWRPSAQLLQPGRWLAIHAGLVTSPEPPAWEGLPASAVRVLDQHIGRARQLPHGAVIALARLGDVLPADDPELVATLSDDERAVGDYGPGRYAWLLDEVIPLDEPSPARGRLGLWPWDVPDGLAAMFTGVTPRMPGKRMC